MSAADRFAGLSAELRQRAAGIRLAAFDVDGTLTDGSLWFNAEGAQAKRFHVHDGYGLKRLRDAGIEVAIISARISHAVALRCQELGIEQIHQGQADKGACLTRLLAALKLDAEACAFMGDDQPDAPALAMAGLAVAPANAHASVLDLVHWQTPHAGGEGAVRDLCDLILAAQGADA